MSHRQPRISPRSEPDLQRGPYPATGSGTIRGYFLVIDMMRERKKKDVIRSDVGVRNPYPLAEAILRQRRIIDEPINWHELTTEEAHRHLHKAFGLPYHQLFDPSFDSHIHRGLHRIGRADPNRAYVLSRRTGGTTGTAPCVGAIAGWKVDPLWRYPPAPPPPPAGGPYGTDIMQGCVADCYFVAALAAIGWVSPSKLQGITDTSNAANNSYTFYTAASQPISPPLSIAKPLPVDTAGQIVGAKPTAGTNVWVSMYEKAYAVFKGQLPAAPDITKLDQGNPVFALTEISGANSDGKLIKASPYYTASTSSFNLSRLFQDINAKCGGSATSGGKTRVPMVAFTYKEQSLTPSGDTYDTDTIVANHAYTILGTMGSNSGWGNSIVLRNPFGIGKPGHAVTGIHDCTPWGGTTTFKISENNFAMEIGTFAKYFEAFGYTI